MKLVTIKENTWAHWGFRYALRNIPAIGYRRFKPVMVKFESSLLGQTDIISVTEMSNRLIHAISIDAIPK